MHTSYSDGTYTPEEILSLARRSGLSAVAITDHDTFSGVAPARLAAIGTGVEIIPGAEVTCDFDGRELHLLAYFCEPTAGRLAAALDRLRAHRLGRFWDMVDRLAACGVRLDQAALEEHARQGTVGRRHLAAMLVESRRARSLREAFHRYLGDQGQVALPKLRLPVAEALELVHEAGGVASWAHPPYDGTRDALARLREMGLDAVEVEYPGHRPARVRQLRLWAAELGLAVTGGSDCHGAGPRAVGSRSITAAELEALRRLTCR
ncbi:MAG: PHP domain-containing protein [Gemmataceae bacterium]|nr:PHP domain-containing protein [Gemmataceae bacterium]MDW8264218.1 PHP domain-containing protein [Gemmataceae bacterium]